MSLFYFAKDIIPYQIEGVDMQDNAIIAKRKGTSKDGNPGGAFLHPY